MELKKTIDGKYIVDGIEGYFKSFSTGRMFEHVFYCVPAPEIGLKTRDFIGSVSQGVYGEKNIKAHRNPDFQKEIKEIIEKHVEKLIGKNPAAVALGSIKSEAKANAARANAAKPRPNAQGKSKPRKPKTE